MLSIVVCSRNLSLPKAFIDNIISTIGIDYEIISIDNSENQYSIFSAYNEGYTKSKYPYLCFVHDDVLFHTQNWGEKIIAHLQAQDTGLIGIAGGDLATRVPASWSTLTPIVNIIQSDRTGKKLSKVIRQPENYDQTSHSVVLLDGVLICMKRELMEKIRFDEQLKGFHGYDFDISFQSTVAGFNNYVIYDIELEHFSRGKTDANYYRNLIAVFKKWEKFLPLVGRSITEDQVLNLPNIEEKSLLRLTKKMIRKGFSAKEIISETHYYATLINSENRIGNLKMQIFFNKLFKCPQSYIK